MAFSSGAVLTAAQLNDFAPGTRVQVPTGSVSAPSVTFAGDTDTGMYRAAANEVALGAAGAARIHVRTTDNVMRGPDATAFYTYLQASSDSGDAAGTRNVRLYFGDLDDSAQAAIYWDEDNTDLQFRGYNDQLAMVINAAEQVEFNTGTESLPSVTFTTDTNTGLYQASANDGQISWTGNGTNGGALVSSGVRVADGSVSAPSFAFSTDTNTGLYLASTVTGTMRFAVQGSNVIQIADSHVSPTTSGVTELGLTGARWQELWSVDITSTNAATTDSDMRLKDPTGDVLGLGFVNRLTPFSGRWKDDTKGEELHQWLSAQDVAAALTAEGLDPSDTSMWKQDDRGSERLAYGELIPVLIRAVQELAEKVDA